jgi:hypothetical protein
MDWTEDGCCSTVENKRIETGNLSHFESEQNCELDVCCVKFVAKSQETVSGGKNGRVQDNKSGALRGAGRDEDELSKWKTTRNCASPLWNLRFSLAFEIAFLL